MRLSPANMMKHLSVAWNVVVGGTCLLLINSLIHGTALTTPFVRIFVGLVLAGVVFEHAEKLRAAPRNKP
jgi:hypothetical protein